MRGFNLLTVAGDFDLSQVIDALDDSIAVIDSSGKIVAVNAAWYRLAKAVGAGRDGGFVGQNYFDVCHQANDGVAEVARAMRRAMDDGVDGLVEYSRPTPDGAEQWFEAKLTLMAGRTGRHVFMRHRDVTQRRVAVENASEAHLRSQLLTALVETSGDAIMSYDLDGRINTWNAGAERLYGYTPEQAIGQSMEVLYPADHAKRIQQYRDEIIAGTLSSFEVTRLTSSGRPRLVWVTAAPIRDASGHIIAVSNIHRDITDLRRHEESRQIVAQEVIHRAKNMLTVISAIHRRTAAMASSMDEFNEKFGERITSLSRSTDFLTSENWQTVPLDALIRSQLALFTADESQVSFGGPDVDLNPQAVKAIGMALHELGTNATKYGALGDHGGKAAIRWNLSPGSDDEQQTLILEWRETGQSFTCAPEHKGFGNTVLTRLAVSLLDATVEYHFGADGILWRISIPPTHFQTRNKEILAAAKT